MKINNQLKYVVLAFSAALLGGVMSLAIYQGVTSPDQNSYEDFREATQANYEIKTVNVPNFDFTEVAEKVTSSVVHIKTKARESDRDSRRNPFEEFFGDRYDFDHQPREGVGSGVIISEEGHIITNKHVIHQAGEIIVGLDDNRQFEADVVGEDPHTDLAVLKIDAGNLKPLAFGDSDELRVGEWVVAVGNPFNLKSTVTAGIVSAKARNINLLGGGASIESFIQTDAAVNPGNSGGALVNTKGELIGINTAIATQTGQYAGYSFAVPSNITSKVIADIMEFGEVQRGFIGVNIRNVDQDIANEKGLDKIAGALVENLMEGGAAAEAGIERGDVIISIDDQEVSSVPHLQEHIGMHRPGDEVKVTVVRDGNKMNFDVVLRSQDGSITLVSDDREKIKRKLGAEFENVSQADKEKHDISSGVIVKSIKGGKLKEAGVPEGFIVTRIDNRTVHTPADIFRVFERKNEGGVLLEGINPDGSRGYYGFGLDG